MRSPVIAFSGPPGAGKSTLVRTICSLRPDFRPVSYDDFPNQTARNYRDMGTWFENSGDPNDFRVPALEAHLERLLGVPTYAPVLFETLFGRTHRQTGRFIDILVWIDVPLEVALARQLRAICRQRRDPTLQEYATFIAGLDVFLRNYERLSLPLYKQQARDVRGGADVILDGLQPSARLAETVLAALPADPRR